MTGPAPRVERIDAPGDAERLAILNILAAYNETAAVLMEARDVAIVFVTTRARWLAGCGGASAIAGCSCNIWRWVKPCAGRVAAQN
jgi:hypothetical protein